MPVKSNKVEITFTSDDRDIIQSLQKQNAMYEKQIQKLQQVSDKSNRASRDQSSGLNSIIGMTIRAASGYASISLAMSTISQANRELIQEAQRVSTLYDEIFRKFQVQAGLTEVQKGSAQERIVSIAKNLAVPVDQATAAATQLVSSGFSTSEATGGGLSNFIKVLKATNQGGADVDPAELALALSQFLAANQLDKTGENVIGVGQNLQALFQGTNVQLSGLTPLASVTGAINKQTTFQEQLAAQSTLVESFQAPQAAVGLRNFVQILSGAREDKIKAETLGRLGVNPDDVDFTGENFQSVLDRLGGAFDTIPAEQRAGVSQKLFGREGAQFGDFLIDNRDTFRRNLALQSDSTPFNQALQTATSGRNAAAVRQQIEKDTFSVSQNQNDDLLLSELDAITREQGVGVVRRFAYRNAYSALRAVGSGPRSAALGAFGGIDNEIVGSEGRPDIYSQARERVEQKMLGVLQNIDKNTRPNRTPRRNEE